jgi:hypothetical protein
MSPQEQGNNHDQRPNDAACKSALDAVEGYKFPGEENAPVGEIRQAFVI